MANETFSTTYNTKERVARNIKERVARNIKERAQGRGVKGETVSKVNTK